MLGVKVPRYPRRRAWRKPCGCRRRSDRRQSDGAVADVGSVLGDGAGVDAAVMVGASCAVDCDGDGLIDGAAVVPSLTVTCSLGEGVVGAEILQAALATLKLQATCPVPSVVEFVRRCWA